jgi:hypothetical protein
MKPLGPNDLSIAGLAAVSGTPADTAVLPLSDGSTAKWSLNQMVAYIEQRGRQNNASVAQQTFAATDAYGVR